MRNRQPDGGLSGEGSSPVSPLWSDRVVRVRLGDRGQQRLGVGMGGVPVQVVGRGHLDQLPQVHHRHPVAHVLDHGQVVGDEDHGETEPGLEVGQQIEDLGLDGHVEGGDRLVADEQVGVGHQGPGDADALALAAGELPGRRSPAVSGSIPTASSISRTLAARSSLVPRPQMTRGSATMSLTRRRGLSDEIGSWKIIWILVRIRRSCRVDRSLRFWPR